MRWCRLSWQIRPGRHQKEIVCRINDVLGTHVLFALLLFTNRAIHTHMRDFVHVRVLVLQDKSASKGHNQVLQEVDGGLPAQPETTILEQLTLFFRLL